MKMTLYIDSETKQMAKKLASKDERGISAFVRRLIRKEYEARFAA